MRAALLALPLALGLALATVATAGLPADTGGDDTGIDDTGTGDTGTDDSAPTTGAAGLAGEEGGCAGCAVPGATLGGLVPLLSALLLVRRRR